MFSLKKMFGKQVRVTVGAGIKEAPFEWYEQIVGKRGLIYPQSLVDDTVCVQSPCIQHKKMMELFGDKATFKRRGDAEYEFIIPVSLVRSTFRYIKPKKYRQLTEDQKNILRLRLAALRPAEGSGSRAVNESN